MTTTVTLQPGEPFEPRSDAVAKRQIRGSALLMVGRGISLALNFSTQILIVRHFSKLDYGAFAYGLSMVSLASSFTVFGLDKAASRWTAIYDEHEDHGKILGTLLLMGGTILGLGAGVILTVFGLRGYLGSHVVSSPLSLTMLLSLIVLAPVDALNKVLQSVFAVFSNARLIFFRRHVVGPGLKLAAVVAVIVSSGSVRKLATAYVVAGLLGLVIGLALLVHVLRRRGLWTRLKQAKLRIPLREIYGFSLPMLHSDLVFVLRGSMVVFFLEYFHDSIDVAAYRSVLPAARLNRLVLESFSFMFMPAVARLLARNAMRAVDEVHWRSAGWITMLSFPVFAVTFSMAQPVTVLLFGERYAESGQILALLSLGYFLNAALGLNALTLKVCGKIRHILAIDFLAILIALTASLVLIPRYGAIGAAVGVCVAMIVHALLNQIGLAISAGLRLFPRQYARIYVLSALGVLGLMQVQAWWAPPIYLGVLLAGAVWLLLIVLCRQLLAVDETFPELLRIPLIRRLFGAANQGQGPGARQ